ncbi:hypothetical protein ETD83_00585 [Actinomadura soli]|uniref:Uncharacterized protein n=1 Tax=Actinomadura soli TaxID=2508997 RepID=A0A5C4JLF0_9ACTN|nr:hypothetical protein [Actinomadura soli]TMR07507.1 hypothetical protein ETD83_00585 [Actinomadura soli]
MLAASGPDALVVLDDVRSPVPHPVEQLWHLPPAFTAVPRGTGAVATAGRVRVHFLRIPLPGTAASPARTVRGSLDPLQGWVARGHRKKAPAPVVSLPARGSRVRTLTLIAPVRGTERPGVRVRPLPGGGVRVDASFSGHRLGFVAGPDGGLHRVR